MDKLLIKLKTNFSHMFISSKLVVLVSIFAGLLMLFSRFAFFGVFVLVLVFIDILTYDKKKMHVLDPEVKDATEKEI